MNDFVSSLDLSYELKVRLDDLLQNLVDDLRKESLQLSCEARSAIKNHFTRAHNCVIHDVINAENGDAFVFPDFLCLHCEHSHDYISIPHMSNRNGDFHHETFGFRCRIYADLYGEDIILGNMRTCCWHYKEAAE